IHLQTKVLLAVTWMQTLSAKHPVQEWLTNALRIRTAVITYRSNLESVLQQFPHTMESIESIEPYIRPPWWTLKAKTEIEKTKEIAKTVHDKIQEVLNAKVATIYMDGSGIDQKLGVAAYALMSGEISLHHL